MSVTIDSLKRRNIRVYEIQAGPELVKVTVEAAKAGETKVGVTVALDAHSPGLDSAEVDVALLGSGHFNPVAFPRDGALPELRLGGRAAVAAFRFEPVAPGSSPKGLELRLRGRCYEIRFRNTREAVQRKSNAIPASVAKLLPKTWRSDSPK
jgi:hypothetical protein